MQERAIFRVRSIFMESSDKDGGGNTEPIMGEKIIRPVVADGKKVARWHKKKDASITDTSFLQKPSVISENYYSVYLNCLIEPNNLHFESGSDYVGSRLQKEAITNRKI